MTFKNFYDVFCGLKLGEAYSQEGFKLIYNYYLDDLEANPTKKTVVDIACDCTEHTEEELKDTFNFYGSEKSFKLFLEELQEIYVVLTNGRGSFVVATHKRGEIAWLLIKSLV